MTTVNVSSQHFTRTTFTALTIITLYEVPLINLDLLEDCFKAIEAVL